MCNDRFRVRAILGIGCALTLAFASMLAHGETAGDRTAREFVEMWTNQSWEGVAYAIHPDELDRVRKRVLGALEAEAKDGASDVRTRLFGAGVTLDDVEHMTPQATMTALVKRFLTAPRAAHKTVAVGSVKESGKLTHFVVRAYEDEKGKGASSVLLVSLIPYGQEWAAAVPAEVDETIAAAIAGAAVGARDIGERHVAALDPAIAKLLDSGIAALKEARCTDYYHDIMSPNFREATSKSALRTLVEQCSRNPAMRDRTRLTLEIARGLRPAYEYGNTRAVFDMKGQGLPFDRFVVELVDRKWYVAE
jgi:hypothetical protein